jgi:hypothetical protein
MVAVTSLRSPERSVIITSMSIGNQGLHRFRTHLRRQLLKNEHSQWLDGLRRLVFVNNLYRDHPLLVSPRGLRPQRPLRRPISMPFSLACRRNSLSM